MESHPSPVPKRVATPSTIASLLTEAEPQIKESDTARLDAEILLCHVLKRERAHLYGFPDRSIPPRIEARYRELIAERARGVPVAHLTRQREFWSLRLEVTEHTLIPRPETEHLVELALSLVPRNSTLEIADLGTGSGNLALAIANERPRCRLIATDISEGALTVARRNARRLRLDNVTFRQGHWYQALAQKRFDLIVSNPPYVALGDPCLMQGDLRFEPPMALAGGADGLAAIRHVVAGACLHLRPGGWLVLEHGYDQKRAVQALMHAHGFQSLRCSQDYAGRDRVTVVRFTET